MKEYGTEEVVLYLFGNFSADGGNIKISGLTTTDRCLNRKCVKQLVQKMIKAPESPPLYIRDMVESVLRHFLKMVQEIDRRTSVSAGAAVRLYDGDVPELTLDISLAYGAPPRTYYDEYDLLDDGKDEWYATINSCYCGFETHYDVEKVLYFGREYESNDNPLRFETNKRELRRAVITTVKQAYNAEP